MTYLEWLTWLESRTPMPQIKPGLDRMRKALEASGLSAKVPRERVILIAGTNGKGTTAKTLEQLFLARGFKVGLYTSPHLVDTGERIRTNGLPLSSLDFVKLCEHYRPLIEAHDLTHFETLTLFAVDVFFARNPCDWGIFEVGLGGTWDATNAIEHDTSIITTLGWDHAHILGPTLSDIADNKFGIIQKNNCVFHWTYPETLEARLEQRLSQQQAQSRRISPPRFRIEKTDELPATLLTTPWGEVALSLPGARAAENMWMALSVFAELGMDAERALPSLSQIQWPARMTRLGSETVCPVYLSGDHNLQGIESLLEILKQMNYDRLHVILGLSKNRHHDEFIERLKALPRSQLTFTKPTFQGVTPTQALQPFYERPIEALHHVLQNAKEKDIVVVTGSLYLCGDILREQKLLN